MIRRFFVSFILIVMCFAIDAVYAQENRQFEDIKKNFGEIQVKVEALEKASMADSVTDAVLASNKIEMEAFSQKTFELALQASALLKNIDAQLAEIGPKSEDPTVVEPESVVLARQSLVVMRGELALTVRGTENLAVNISAIIEKIIKLRSDKFAADIFSRHPMSLNVWDKVQNGLSLEWRRLDYTYTNWVRLLTQTRAFETIIALLISIGFAVSVAVSTRLFIRPFIGRSIEASKPPYLRRVFSALWSTLVPSMAISLSLGVCYFAFWGLSLLPPRVEEIFRATLVSIGLLAFVIFLTRAVLAPGRANWRVFEISERAARRLSFLISLMAVVYCGDYLMAEIRGAMSFPIAINVLTSFVSALLFAAILFLILITDLTEDPKNGKSTVTHGWAVWIYWPMLIAIIVIAAAAISGYISLAHFIAGQIVVTGAILVAMYISMLSARAVSRTGAFKESLFGDYLIRRLGFSEIAVDQLGLVFGGLLIVAALVVGIPFVLLQWGFQRHDVQSGVSRFFSGFNIGDVRISFANIVLAIIVFVVALILTRIFQRWFAASVLTRTRLDTGVKHSIGAGIGYVGFIIAALLALDYTGIDLSNLALIAGALSVGIGFGLQNVVSNFVSGIILLIERPIRVGDWIVVGDKEGYVKKISVRATELETFDRQSIIIPNGELINTSVGNWMLKDKTGRVIIEVGVSYDSDELAVRDILYDLIAADDRIATSPEPFIRFKDFGDNALVFELRVFLKDIGNIIKVASDMRFAIRKAFKESGIVIPFPQRDIHMQTGAPTELAATTRSKDL